MIGAYLRRGVAAGLVAGVLAGLIGLVIAEPSLDTAIALEESAGHVAAADDSGAEFTRAQQKAGLVAGYALVGMAVGGVFAIASAWAVGRVRGDGWVRSLKLGAVALAALTLLPALKYPPNPPGVGEPATVGTRTALYLAAGFIGLLLAAAAWAGGRQLAQRASRPARQAGTAAAVTLAAAAVVAVLPGTPDTAGGFPAEVLWRFRLGALGTQAALWLALAMTFGLLTARAERGDGSP